MNFRSFHSEENLSSRDKNRLSLQNFLSRCHDPFNFTNHKKDMPDTMKCEGCCVKLVQHRGSSKLPDFAISPK